LASSSIKSSSSSESTGEMFEFRRLLVTPYVNFLYLKSIVFFLNRLFDANSASLLVGKNLVIISFALSIKLTS